MLSKIYTYELKNWLKKPDTYIYVLVFFAVALVTMLGTGGFFDEPSTATDKVRLLNSPHEINYLLQFFNKFFLFLLPAIIGMTIYKDYKSRTHSILYSYPIDKKGYLLGKLFGALSIVLLITFSVGAAFLLSEIILGTANPQIGVTNVLGYIQTYLVFIIPNMLMYGALVFLVVTATRNIYAGFVAVIVLFLVQIIAENLFVNNNYLIGLFDPFAQNAVGYETRFWTLDQRNTQFIPLSGIVMFNRLLWIGIISVMFVFFYKAFKFNQDGFQFKFKKAKGKRLIKNNFQSTGKVYISKVNHKYDFRNSVKTLWELSKMEFLYVIKNPMFLVLAAGGIMTMIFVLTKVTNTGNMVLLPVTRIMISGPAFFFTLLAMVITFLFCGMLVHRPKSTRMNLLTDITPTPNWVFMLSKVIALIKMQIMLLFGLMLSGIIIQLYNGFMGIDLGLYIFHLFVIILPVLIIWALASIFVHTLVPKLYLGLFVLILGWIAVDSLPMAGITSRLFRFNAPDQLKYSDLDGYGSSLPSYMIVESYWMFFGFLLLILALLLWRRGFTFSIKERFSIMKSRFEGRVALLTSILFSVFITLGFMIHRGEQKVQFSSQAQKKALKNFKEDYESYKDITTPKISAVKIELDIYPERKTFNANGEYVIINTSEKSIDTLLIKTGFDEITSYELSLANKIISKDSMMQFAIHKLSAPILPKDSITMTFEVKNKVNTLFERNSTALKNGTFILNNAFPRLGYFINEEKKSPMDSTARKTNYAAWDADLVSFEAIVSTSDEQTAIAPGYLKREWKENGRNYYHYKMDKNIKLLYAFNSGKFEKTATEYKGVNLEIYSHKKHQSNNEAILNGLKAAIDYNSKFFSPYQHREARVIEFPDSEGTFATTAANSIPMSETRFIINSKEENDKIDLSFYVPAHELTHQWWGNQLIPADAYGAKMLTESITEYISLNIYKEFYGQVKADNFLKFQRNRYLRGRTRDSKGESPLYLVNDDQTYISYGKGAMAFNTLRHYLGEEVLNNILKEFLLEYQYRTDEYPTSLDLIRVLKEQIPEQYIYLIRDMFEEITFYDAKINSAKLVSSDKEKFTVEVDLDVSKYRKDNMKSTLKLNDFIELGFYNSNNELISIEKKRITKSKNKLLFELKMNPSRIVIDPKLLIIELDIKDNQLNL